jgi:hypothetical protein
MAGIRVVAGGGRERRGRPSGANFSLPRRTALSLLSYERTARVGINNKRLQADRYDADLQKVMCGTGCSAG